MWPRGFWRSPHAHKKAARWGLFSSRQCYLDVSPTPEPEADTGVQAKATWLGTRYDLPKGTVTENPKAPSSPARKPAPGLSANEETEAEGTEQCFKSGGESQSPPQPRSTCRQPWSPFRTPPAARPDGRESEQPLGAGETGTDPPSPVHLSPLPTVFTSSLCSECPAVLRRGRSPVLQGHLWVDPRFCCEVTTPRLAHAKLPAADRLSSPPVPRGWQFPKVVSFFGF